MRPNQRKQALLIILLCFLSFYFISRSADCKERFDEEVMDIRENLERTVRFLAEDIGPRAYLHQDALNRAAEYIGSEMRSYGYDVLTQPYDVDGAEYRNVFAVKKGLASPERVLVVGAHYDTVIGTPGADDNASAVAGLLELARLTRGAHTTAHRLTAHVSADAADIWGCSPPLTRRDARSRARRPPRSASRVPFDPGRPKR